MSGSIFTRRRIAGLGSLVVFSLAMIASSAAPAGAQSANTGACPAGPPVLMVGNPNPGDVISQGDYIISGVAFDPAATDGAGILRVDLFLGSRDNGGVLLASATPDDGFTSPRAFEVKATVPSTANGQRDFIAYAYSAVDSQVTTVSFPVFVGAAPTPTPSSSTAPAPIPLTETQTSTCTGSSSAAPASTTVSSSVAPAAPASTSALQSGAVNSAPVLSLANPSAGDVLPVGDIIIQGVAYDPTATQGAGIDRVDLFLDNRDSGGMILGSATPAADHTFKLKVTLPSTANGGHTVFAYAHSSATSQETVVSVPVFVGVAPTPTPRPTS